MRHISNAILAVALAGSFPVCADDSTNNESPDSPLQGTWRLVASKYGDAPEFQNALPEETMIKLVTDTHFTWVRFDSETKEVSHAAGGRCTVDGGTYTEHIPSPAPDSATNWATWPVMSII